MSENAGLAVQVRELAGRLDRIEATLLRLERLMVDRDHTTGDAEAFELGARRELV